MTIKYRANLIAGCIAIAMAVALYIMIPLQIKAETQTTFGVTSRTMPYMLCALMGISGVGLIFQSLVLKKDKILEIHLGQELKAACYIACLWLYSTGFTYSFLMATSLLGVVTLAFSKCKKPLYYIVIIITTVVIYFVFTELLHVRLP